MNGKRRAFWLCDDEFTEAHALKALESMPSWAREDESDLAVSETDGDGYTVLSWNSPDFGTGNIKGSLHRLDRFRLADGTVEPGELTVILHTPDDLLRINPQDAGAAAAVLLEVAELVEAHS